MAWFKTDDRLPNHRKARAVRKSHPTKRRDVAPFGIWVLAGALSDDGFIPLEILEDWDDDAAALAERLVAAGMWHATSRDGEPGYVFHDWHDQNPARDDNDPSSTGTFGNHIRWHVQRKMIVEGCAHCPTEPSADDRGDIGPIIGPDIGVIGAESLPARPGPTRPDPNPTRTTSSDKPDQTDPNRFDEFWETYSHKVGRKKAETAYAAALKKPGITDELLIAAAGSYIDWQRSEDKHPQYTKHPSTWLNGEHWADERTARQAPKSNVQQHIELARRLAAGEGATIHEIGGPR